MTDNFTNTGSVPIVIISRESVERGLSLSLALNKNLCGHRFKDAFYVVTVMTRLLITQDKQAHLCLSHWKQVYSELLDFAAVIQPSCRKRQIINLKKGNKRKDREAKYDGGEIGKNCHGNERKYKCEKYFKVACNRGRYMTADHTTANSQYTSEFTHTS
jgi:hypothetical protein